MIVHGTMRNIFHQKGQSNKSHGRVWEPTSPQKKGQSKLRGAFFFFFFIYYYYLCVCVYTLSMAFLTLTLNCVKYSMIFCLRLIQE